MEGRERTWKSVLRRMRLPVERTSKSVLAGAAVIGKEPPVTSHWLFPPSLSPRPAKSQGPDLITAHIAALRRMYPDPLHILAKPEQHAAHRRRGHGHCRWRGCPAQTVAHTSRAFLAPPLCYRSVHFFPSRLCVQIIQHLTPDNPALRGSLPSSTPRRRDLWRGGRRSGSRRVSRATQRTAPNL